MNTRIVNARILTLAGPRRRRASSLGDLGVIRRGSVHIDGETIVDVQHEGPQDHSTSMRDERVIDARGRVLMPGFVDAHTHACWAGTRLDEWELQLRGEPYLDILARGGGIMSTVRAVRQASEQALTEGLVDRLNAMLVHGTTTVEVKSGYGLTTTDELKMLHAIRRADDLFAGEVVPTALLGHAIDRDTPDFVNLTIQDTLDAVHEAFPGITVDAYCEQGAWSLAECARLFEKAIALGHPIRAHADQFHSLGLVEWAVAKGAVSVDHLEAATTETIAALAGSDTFGVLLPCAGFHTDNRFAPGRTLVDAGGLLGLATNYNPGSAPCGSMPTAMALAVRKAGLTPAEAIVAATLHGAEILHLHDRGQIVPGQRADLVLLRHDDERCLTWEFGFNPVEIVWVAGRPVVDRSQAESRSCDR
ncbi:MAG: imidazolonepropionase [Phycisphaeraceae bacterium]|nr:imidazolonepropionase [Phycisphaeraceae bacterium]MCW5755313.1 imidazolonepropionase [Phycisphaeraceae bacterium]